MALVMEWLRNSAYHVSHAGSDIAVVPRRGIRQGCVLSPLLWSCATGLLLTRMQPILSDVMNTTMYADDFLQQDEVDSVSDLRAAIQRAGRIVDFFSSAGLQASSGKSAIMIRIAGRKARETLKGFLVKQNGQTFVRTSEKDGHLFPLVMNRKYLGAVLSYHGFEDATLHERIGAARNNYTRLKKLLHGHKELRLCDRLKIWQTCVWSSLTYSLPCVGVTSAGAALRISEQLRCRPDI